MSDSKIQDFGIPYLSADQIRASFFQFFESKDHKFIKSDGVFPKDDPTLLFTNAGMNQFKSVFLGDNRHNLRRVHNSQKCLRVSGKHNDLDEVGRDSYHHTMFEMLGNWSFGDYYKKEAIEWAWELLTKVWKLPKNRIFVTVYKDDLEAEGLWQSLTDIEHHRIMRFDERANFWEMGAVGPCGPCSEIHFDLGDLSTQHATYQDPIGGVNGSNGRYVEIWNLVFMQYERRADGSLVPLTQTHVDTGSGFERICSVIQNTGSNYETDLFKPIIEKIAAISAVPYQKSEAGTPHRVIADHIRALGFAIADGATPGNEGRGYVLRRILRRASRFAHGLGQKNPFLFKIVDPFADVMKSAFPEVDERRDYIKQVIEAEERRFLKTLDAGLIRMERLIDDLKKQDKNKIDGKDVFQLYDTYGFPTDLTRMIALENGFDIDEQGYHECMEIQREKARSATKFNDAFTVDESWTILADGKATDFVGYNTLTSAANVLRYLELNDELYLVLDKTPFYAESGGQVGDTGIIKGTDLELKVIDTFKVLDLWIHRCQLLHGLVSGESLKRVQCLVHGASRQDTFRNHSATHLLHSALRQVLGTHVVQQGSYVAPDRLRFDFTHPQSLSKAELMQIETLVNEEILSNHPIISEIKPFDEAKSLGAMALFGEKYGETVRVITMGAGSKEFCGGTHASATGEIGCFFITNETSIAAGIRRIEAITGNLARHTARQQFDAMAAIAKIVNVQADKVEEKIEQLIQNLKAAEKTLERLKLEQINDLVDGIIAKNKKRTGSGLGIVAKLDANIFPKPVQQKLLESMAAKFPDGVSVLTIADPESLSILATVGQSLRAKLNAGNLVKELGTIAGGKGGGRPDKAQAGSKFPEKEHLVLEAASRLIADALS